MAETYRSRFELVLGDLNSELYRDMVRWNSTIVSKNFKYPTLRIVERIVADSEGLGFHWPLGIRSNCAVVKRCFKAGNLAAALEEIDILVSLVKEIERERPGSLPTAGSQVLARYENNLSELLELLSAPTRDEIPVLVEELLVLAKAFYFTMTPKQVASIKKARKLGDRLWTRQANSKILSKFIDLMEPLLVNLYPLEHPLEIVQTDEVYRLLKLIKDIQGDMEVMELWDSLTASGHR